MIRARKFRPQLDDDNHNSTLAQLGQLLRREARDANYRHSKYRDIDAGPPLSEMLPTKKSHILERVTKQRAMFSD